MNTHHRTSHNTFIRDIFTTRILKSLAALAASMLFSTAANATGVELIALVVPANADANRLHSPEQSLATINVQSSFDAGTHRQLAMVARYPNNSDARRQRLHGAVSVEFEIDRQGVLQDAGIAQSSRSRILDAAALKSVHWAKYQAIPAELAPGETGRRYRVTFDYRFNPQD